MSNAWNIFYYDYDAVPQYEMISMLVVVIFFFTWIKIRDVCNQTTDEDDQYNRIIHNNSGLLRPINVL